MGEERYFMKKNNSGINHKTHTVPYRTPVWLIYQPTRVRGNQAGISTLLVPFFLSYQTLSCKLAYRSILLCHLPLVRHSANICHL